MVQKKDTKKPAAGRKPGPAPKAAKGKAPAKAATASKTAAPAASRAPKPKTPAVPRPPREPKAAPARAAVDTRPAALGVHDLRPSPGSTHSRKRLGRGPGSGHGKTAGRGNKGQKSRSGYRHQRGFEGGQMPLHRRVPKRGFNNIFRQEYEVVNLDTLGERFEAGVDVTVELLRERGIITRTGRVKVLGRGEITKALTVHAHKFSGTAADKIAAAGGKAEVLA